MKCNLFLGIIAALVFSGCSGLISGIYGMKKLKPLDKKTILEYSVKYKVDPADNFELDTTYFMFLNRVDTFFYKEARKNHYQPLQVLYYDKTGKLNSYLINCYTRGIPNLKWNRGGILNTFLPKQQAPADSILPLYEHLKYLRPLPGAKRFSFGQDDYIVILYWSRYMGRQSSRLIAAIQENVKLAGNKKVRVIYVNTDNFFSKALKPSR